MPYCKDCGYEYVVGVKQCPDCHLDLSEGEQLFCDACEEVITTEATFCPHCGVLLGWSEEGGDQIFCSTHSEIAPVGRCVICGKPVCDECAARKNGKIFCSNDEHAKMAFDWVAIVSTSTEYEAQMIKSNLEGAGISAVVLSQQDRMYFATVGDLAVNEVMVPKRMAEEARQILLAMDYDQGEGEAKDEQ